LKEVCVVVVVVFVVGIEVDIIVNVDVVDDVVVLCTFQILFQHIFNKGREKCSKYWPDNVGDEVLFGNFNVKLLKQRESTRKTIVERTLQACNTITDRCRSVVQLHYVAWPDFGVPHATADANDVLALLRDVARRESAAVARRRAPLLVHCSAGVGRTGALLCLQTMLERLIVAACDQHDADADDDDELDPSAVVAALRRQRHLMVQTAQQYAFCVELAARVVEANLEHWRARPTNESLCQTLATLRIDDDGRDLWLAEDDKQYNKHDL
jgi:protein tyrosine phosphatase